MLAKPRRAKPESSGRGGVGGFGRPSAAGPSSGASPAPKRASGEETGLKRASGDETGLASFVRAQHSDNCAAAEALYGVATSDQSSRAYTENW